MVGRPVLIGLLGPLVVEAASPSVEGFVVPLLKIGLVPQQVGAAVAVSGDQDLTVLVRISHFGHPSSPRSSSATHSAFDGHREPSPELGPPARLVGDLVDAAERNRLNVLPEMALHNGGGDSNQSTNA